MDIQTWYGTGITLPKERDHHRYPMFLANTMGLVRTVVKRKLDTEVKVRFAKIDTASMDHDANCINISTDFYGGYLTKDGLRSDIATTITAIMGIVIHELAHLAWSPKTLEPWANLVATAKHLPYNAELAMSVGNLVEDVYIESRLGREVSSMTWTLDCINGLMWSGAERADRRDKAMGINDHPTSMEEVGILYNLGLLVKVEDNSINPFVDGYLSLVAEAREEQSIESRLELGLRVYEFLVKNLPPLECKSPKEGGEMDGAGITADHSTTKAIEKATKTVDATGTDIANSKLQRIESEILTIAEGGSFTNLFNEIGIEGRFNKPALSIGVNEKYSLLGQLARQVSAVNRPYGQQMERGHTIRGLYRIATDQRIFAEQMKVQHPRPMEVAILVDCSGSMRWGVNNNPFVFVEKEHTRIYKALSACIGAAESLANFQAMVSVWGHTADVEQKYTCTIFRFKGWHESVVGLKRKAEFFLGNMGFDNYTVSGNRDGDALSYVGKKFSPSGTRKMLIVISDGLPNAEGYGGDDAEAHCRSKIAELRARGVHVQSISITQEAHEANDRIYGSAFNVNDNDPNVIAGIVASLIEGKH